MNTHSEPVNMRLHFIKSFICAHEGACDGCGLPSHLGCLMGVPGIPGHFCCVECVEGRLFGPGRCRWCGFPLAARKSAYCSDKCRTLNQTSPFGSGKRFTLWLNRHEPRLFAVLVGKEIPTGIACLHCGDALDGKRRDSLFCRSKCRKRFKWSHNNPANTKQKDYTGHEPFACVSAGNGQSSGGISAWQ